MKTLLATRTVEIPEGGTLPTAWRHGTLAPDKKWSNKSSMKLVPNLVTFTQLTTTFVFLPQ
jgi:hypothetical protein